MEPVASLISVVSYLGLWINLGIIAADMAQNSTNPGVAQTVDLNRLQGKTTSVGGSNFYKQTLCDEHKRQSLDGMVTLVPPEIKGPDYTKIAECKKREREEKENFARLIINEAQKRAKNFSVETKQPCVNKVSDESIACYKRKMSENALKKEKWTANISHNVFEIWYDKMLIYMGVVESPKYIKTPRKTSCLSFFKKYNMSVGLNEYGDTIRIVGAPKTFINKKDCNVCMSPFGVTTENKNTMCDSECNIQVQMFNPNIQYQVDNKNNVNPVKKTGTKRNRGKKGHSSSSDNNYNSST